MLIIYNSLNMNILAWFLGSTRWVKPKNPYNLPFGKIYCDASASLAGLSASSGKALVSVCSILMQLLLTASHIHHTKFFTDSD
jgi:hypothetical protein